MKRRAAGGCGDDSDADNSDDDNNDDDINDDNARFWHLPGPLDPSLPLPEAPESFSSNCCLESENSRNFLVDVAARVSDGAGGDLWLRASGLPLLEAAPLSPAEVGGGGDEY